MKIRYIKPQMIIKIMLVTLSLYGYAAQAEESRSIKIIAPVDNNYIIGSADDRKNTKENLQLVNDLYDAVIKKDWETAGKFYADSFVQHGAGIKAGRAGAIEYFKSVNFDKLDYTTVMTFADGNHIARFNRVIFSPGENEMVWLDINRVKDGKIYEHWDIITPAYKPNRSGHHHFDHVIDNIKVDAATRQKNKQVVVDYINTAFNQKRFDDALEKYIGKDLIEHNNNGLDGIKGISDNFNNGVFDSLDVDIRRLIAQDDLVLVHSRVIFGGTAFSAAGILRIRDGKMVEHWDMFFPIPAELPHVNGMF